jgi:hypothetical protein
MHHRNVKQEMNVSTIKEVGKFNLEKIRRLRHQQKIAIFFELEVAVYNREFKVGLDEESQH